MDDAQAPTFQRARRPEQRQQRRQEILVAAEALLTEVPADQISLRELARRLDVSKTHVVRYFESREGVFLELLHRKRLAWLEAVPREWPAPPCPQDAVMRALADSLAARPVLVQLWSLLPTVLERNVSAATVHAYKLADLDHRRRLAALVRERVPQIRPDEAMVFTEHAAVGLVGLWPFSSPPPAVAEAVLGDPRLARATIDFPTRYAELLQVILAGLIAHGWRTTTP